MKAEQVAKILDVGITDEGIEFTSVTTDSRSIKGGELFVALRGEKYDGHNFVVQALEKGARGVVISRDMFLSGKAIKFLVADTLAAYQQLARAHRLENKNLHVIGITGSNGKTSTKDMLAACLATKYRVVKTKANFNNEIGLPMTLFNLQPDTEVAVVEMGMRGLGQIRSLCKIARPESGLITNVGATHLELLGSLENIAQAKAEITEKLPVYGFVVLNGDQKLCRQAVEHTQAQVFYFGMDTMNDYYGENVQMNLRGTDFLCVEKCTGRKIQVHLPFLGLHNVYNALAAITMAVCYGVQASESALALSQLQLTDKRLQVVKKGGLIFIDDSYNASPASMKSALEVLQMVKKGSNSKLGVRSVAVLADMLELGNLSREAHAEVGKWCADFKIDYVFVYGKEVQSLYFAAKKLGVQVQYCRDLRQTYECLDHVVKDGDIILLKGSHSMEVGRIMDYFEN